MEAYLIAVLLCALSINMIIPLARQRPILHDAAIAISFIALIIYVSRSEKISARRLSLGTFRLLVLNLIILMLWMSTITFFVEGLIGDAWKLSYAVLFVAVVFTAVPLSWSLYAENMKRSD